MVNIGERIKYIRETYDISQKNLAHILHLEKSSISHFEKNDRIIPIEHLIAFSDYLDLSIDYILGLTDIKKQTDRKTGIHLSIMAKNICQIAHEQQLTNVALAKILHSCESNIRNYKNGKYLILTTLALELAIKYNYSMDWILGKTEKKTRTYKHKLPTNYYITQ